MAVAVTERSMGNDKARDLRYFFPSKYSERNSALRYYLSETNCAIIGSDVASDEPTRHESRRKRQRTTSSHQQCPAPTHVVAGVACHELRNCAHSSSKDVVASITTAELKNAGPAPTTTTVTHTIQKPGRCGPSYSKLTIPSRTSPDSEGAGIFGLGGKPNNSVNPKASRFPGAMEPIWPPKEMTHIRPHTNDIMLVHPPLRVAHISPGGRKMKYVKVQISAHDDILRPYVRLTQMERETLENDLAADTLNIRRPRRIVMTGLDLQHAVWKNLVATLPPPTNLHGLRDDEVDELSNSHWPPRATHSALLNMYKKIPDSLTAFDKFECETQDWVHKYAPKKAEDVLQSGREALILRDWLKSLTVSSVESGSGNGSKAHEPSAALGRTERRVKRKKRKRTEDLADFLVSSEEEEDQMDELVELEDTKGDIDCDILSKKTVVRSKNVCGAVAANSQKAINAVVISGHHGCGKTAAVYAAAQELGFDVFEINAGSRRSGKDLLDKVGDMTQNHLVNHAQEKERDQDRPDSLALPESTKMDIESGRQTTVNSFFKPKTKPDPKSVPQASKMPKNHVERQKLQNQKPQSQKQSLILLEEVDVLFEEDKHFWATTLDLLISSKRPIVMTCTDESLLPLDEMLLFAILRFTAPPQDLAVDYLLLVACNEGHFLSRATVSALFKSKKFDLRASITELNFFCQMAIGDTKGGLEWMLIRSSSQEFPNELGLMLRVVSDGSYFAGMGCLSHEQGDQDESNEGERFYQNISYEHSVDNADLKRGQCGNPADQTSRGDAFQLLETLDLALDCVSVADTIPCSGFRDDDATILDTTSPEIEEKSRASYVDGSTLIQAEPLTDYAGISTALALTLKSCATRLMNAGDINASEFVMPQQLLDGAQNIRSCKQSTRAILSSTFDSIARPLKPPPTLSKGSYISSFDGPSSIIVEDLGPYVRSIVSYDLKLEEHRRQLTMSLCQGRIEGKMRTTRASRAALEGSNKQHVRRERWFPPDTDFSMILQSGGQGWQDDLWHSTHTQVYIESGQEDLVRKSPSSSVASSAG